MTRRIILTIYCAMLSLLPIVAAQTVDCDQDQLCGPPCRDCDCVLEKARCLLDNNCFIAAIDKFNAAKTCENRKPNIDLNRLRSIDQEIEAVAQKLLQLKVKAEKDAEEALIRSQQAEEARASAEAAKVQLKIALEEAEEASRVADRAKDLAQILQNQAIQEAKNAQRNRFIYTINQLSTDRYFPEAVALTAKALQDSIFLDSIFLKDTIYNRMVDRDMFLRTEIRQTEKMKEYLERDSLCSNDSPFFTFYNEKSQQLTLFNLEGQKTLELDHVISYDFNRKKVPISRVSSRQNSSSIFSPNSNLYEIKSYKYQHHLAVLRKEQDAKMLHVFEFDSLLTHKEILSRKDSTLTKQNQQVLLAPNFKYICLYDSTSYTLIDSLGKAINKQEFELLEWLQFSPSGQHLVLLESVKVTKDIQQDKGPVPEQKQENIVFLPVLRIENISPLAQVLSNFAKKYIIPQDLASVSKELVHFSPSGKLLITKANPRSNYIYYWDMDGRKRARFRDESFDSRILIYKADLDKDNALLVEAEAAQDSSKIDSLKQRILRNRSLLEERGPDLQQKLDNKVLKLLPYEAAQEYVYTTRSYHPIGGWTPIQETGERSRDILLSLSRSRLKIWESNGNSIAELRPGNSNEASFTAMKLSWKGNLVAGITKNRSEVRIWETLTGNLISILRCWDGNIKEVKFKNKNTVVLLLENGQLFSYALFKKEKTQFPGLLKQWQPKTLLTPGETKVYITN